jgi:transposase
MSEIPTVGAALAKEVIVVCVGDAQGRTVYLKQLSFGGFGRWAVTLPACTFGMEACSTAHHWGRFLSAQGNKPKLMAAEFVAPFRKRYALTRLPLASDSGAPGAVLAPNDLKER